MKKTKGFFSFYSLTFTQVAVSTMMISLVEMVFGRMGLTATASWQFYVLHLLFLVPFVLFLTPAGYFSDKYPKEKVLVVTTLFSLPVVCLFGLATYLGNMPLVFVSVGLFFILQAIQSPAKNGYMKELMGVRFLSSGSGILMIVYFTALVVSGGAIAVTFVRLVPPSFDF